MSNPLEETVEHLFDNETLEPGVAYDLSFAAGELMRIDRWRTTIEK